MPVELAAAKLAAARSNSFQISYPPRPARSSLSRSHSHSRARAPRARAPRALHALALTLGHAQRVLAPKRARSLSAACPEAPRPKSPWHDQITIHQQDHKPRELAEPGGRPFHPIARDERRVQPSSPKFSSSGARPFVCTSRACSVLAPQRWARPVQNEPRALVSVSTVRNFRTRSCWCRYRTHRSGSLSPEGRRSWPTSCPA